MRHDIDTALDRCLTCLREGTDLDSCLARYPEYADELRPLLELVIDVGRVCIPASAATARVAGKQRMLAALAQKNRRTAQLSALVRYARRVFWSLVPGKPGSPRPAWSLASVMLFVLLVLASGVTVAASADSLPGDLLYPVKLASQKAQLALTFSPAEHEQLQAQYDSQRRLEVEVVLAGGRQVSVDFHGVLQLMEEALWIVDGLPVTLNDATEILGQPYPGALVRVQGQLPGNGEILATRLRVRSVATPPPTVTPIPTNTLLPTASPLPTETPTPTEKPPEPTETSAPTETPEPTATKEATDAALPNAIPELEDAPESVETLEPPETEEPEDTPEHQETLESTGTPEPEDTPESEETPDPTETPEPDDAHEPEETPDSTETPEPDDTSEPEETPDSTETPEPAKTPADEETTGN